MSFVETPQKISAENFEDKAKTLQSFCGLGKRHSAPSISLPPNREVHQDHADDNQNTHSHEPYTNSFFCFFMK